MLRSRSRASAPIAYLSLLSLSTSAKITWNQIWHKIVVLSLIISFNEWHLNCWPWRNLEKTQFAIKKPSFQPTSTLLASQCRNLWNLLSDFTGNHRWVKTLNTNQNSEPQEHSVTEIFSKFTIVGSHSSTIYYYFYLVFAVEFRASFFLPCVLEAKTASVDFDGHAIPKEHSRLPHSVE